MPLDDVTILQNIVFSVFIGWQQWFFRRYMCFNVVHKLASKSKYISGIMLTYIGKVMHLLIPAFVIPSCRYCHSKHLFFDYRYRSSEKIFLNYFLYYIISETPFHKLHFNMELINHLPRLLYVDIRSRPARRRSNPLWSVDQLSRPHGAFFWLLFC